MHSPIPGPTLSRKEKSNYLGGMITPSLTIFVYIIYIITYKLNWGWWSYVIFILLFSILFTCFNIYIKNKVEKCEEEKYVLILVNVIFAICFIICILVTHNQQKEAVN
jgi:4-hydroxybenzoate polyprenyltransferase